MCLVIARGSLLIGIRGRLIPQQQCTRMYVAVVGGSLVIGIRGRLIPQQHCTWKYVVVVGGSLMMWDAILHLAVLG